VRVDQFVPSFVKNDAISNHAVQIRRVLRAEGFDSDIFRWHVDTPMEKESHPYDIYPSEGDQERAVIYHASTDSPMVDWLTASPDPHQLLAIDYHNITPVRYFARWEPVAARSMRRARVELAGLVDRTGLAFADSAFNERELIDLGFRRTVVSPLLLDLDDYHRPPDAETLSELQRLREQGGHRWLFVGRIAPNKCQHDVVSAFAVYRRLFDPAATLALIGGTTSPRYLQAIRELADELELGQELEILSGLSFTQLLAHFEAADVFLCLSEHEGFCVPIIEAMELGVPVVAYRAAAVTDTVSTGGMLLEDKDPLGVACAVADLLDDDHGRAALVANGRERAAAFSLPVTSKQFIDSLRQWLSDGPEPPGPVQ
jgi:glycosyltransferase involved in cell wall biosynthesis